MKGTVHYAEDNNIALLKIDNPPVNPLSSGVRQGLYDGVSKALVAEHIEALVLTGMHRAFIAGADIGEFGEAAQEAVGLNEVIEKIESSKKPVIAAINGTAFGGGLEVALACDYRVASENAPVGLPEVKLGLLPGAGGTQRLPRLIGAEKALAMILSGEPFVASAAKTLGIIDYVVVQDLVKETIEFAKNIVLGGSKTRKIRDISDQISEDRQNLKMFERLKLSLEKTHRGQFAPLKIVECVEAAVRSDNFDDGLATEREKFSECLKHPQREALIHIFFSERAANKIPGLSKSDVISEVKKASVVGAGTMGGGIAMCFANAGISVRLHDNDEDNLNRGMELIRKNYAGTVEKGRISQGEMDKRLSLITPTIEFGVLADGDIVVEAVFENLDLKKEIFSKLDKVMKADAILASNTSGLDIDAIAAVTKRPHSVCGMHFFSPANVMRLLEVIRGAQSSRATLASAMALAKKLDKVAVMAGNCPGFIGNRMLRGYSQQAQMMILEGALPAQIDKVMFDFGLAMGPFAMSDMVGLDLGWRARKMVGGSNEVTARISDELCELGRYGQKNGRGFYQYENGSRTPIEDEDANELIRRVAAELGFEKKEFSNDEILKRCLYPLINTGAKLLSEGHALRAGDIDTVYVNGYGFPKYTGGPMWFADTQGLENVLNDIERFYKETGDDLWRPAELLKTLARDGRTFASLDA